MLFFSLCFCFVLFFVLFVGSSSQTSSAAAGYRLSRRLSSPDRLVGLVVKVSASRTEDLGSIPGCGDFFSGST